MAQAIPVINRRGAWWWIDDHDELIGPYDTAAEAEDAYISIDKKLLEPAIRSFEQIADGFSKASHALGALAEEIK